ncbi:MAG: oxidoreductase [Streptosporangiaceae bacterium]|jgi:NAD(P)-dependent dehydrogenase (short-subunit alcohol dehydrogenase family)
MTQQTAQRGQWSAADVGDQSGRIAVVTGANSGIGLEAARVLAAYGATVVLACRDVGRAEAAADSIRAALNGAPAHAASPAATAAAGDSAGGASARGQAGAVQTVALNLASLASVQDAAAQITERFPRLDLLINNAGVMMPPYRETEDGFELQFGTNHLGHFALTGLVLPSLLQVPGSRVVTVSSNGHKAGRIHFDDLNYRRRYRRMGAYGQSKLANLMFTFELQRRLAAATAPTIAVAAHPGTARTELTRFMPSWTEPLMDPRLGRVNSWFLQDADMGALPTLRAATDPAAIGGDYYGPSGVFELTGAPKRVRSNARSHDEAVARRLWAESQALTGVSYPV